MHPHYDDVLRHLYATGRPVRVRGLDTYEALGTQVQIKAGVFPWRNGLAPGLGVAEGLMILAGVFYPEVIARVAPKADLTLFDESTAYGPRLRTQLPRALSVLSKAPDSRRANMLVSRISDLADAPAPCTTAIQFLVRRGCLETLVTMRSWDVAWGLPYDLMQFGILTMAAASSLGLLPGLVRVTAGSCHVYESTAHLVKLGKRGYGRIEFVDAPPPGSPWTHWVAWARDAVQADPIESVIVRRHE